MLKLKKIIEIIRPAIISALIVFIIFNFIILNGYIPSESMEPTLVTGNFVLGNRLAYIHGQPQRGDIITFNSKEYNKILVKRVIGVSGDIVEIKNNSVYINGEKNNEPYANGDTKTLVEGRNRFEVPDGCVFVMGDNREHSSDSRKFENPYIPYSDIISRVFLEYSIGGSDGIYIRKTE